MKQPLSRWTIRSTLAALALCAMVPSLGIMVYFGLTEIQRSSTEIKAQAMGVAQTLAAQQTLLTENTRLLLTIIAGTPDIISMDRSRAEAVFAKLKRENPIYAGFTLVGADGYLKAASAPFEGVVNLSDRTYFRDVMSTRAFSAGEFVVNKLTGLPQFQFAAPVLAPDGSLVGVVGANFNVSSYEDLFARIFIPSGMRFVIHDREGIRLYRFPKDPVIRSGTRSLPLIHKKVVEAAQDAGVFEETAPEGVDLYYAFVRLRLGPDSPPYMAMLAGAPLPGLKKVITGGFGKAIALMLAALAISLAIAQALGEMTIGTGVDRLIEATRRLSGGDMSARVGDVDACREIVQLGSAFDRMARELAERDQQRLLAETALRMSEMRFRQVFERSPVGIILFDGRGVITACNRKLAEMMNVDDPEKYLGLNLTAHFRDSPLGETVRQTIEMGEAEYEGVHVSIITGKELVIHAQTREISHGVYMAIIEDLTQRVEAEESLRLSLAEKTTLLREVHHRVKNNLQIITSLINLQASRLADPAARDAFAQMQGRVRSMAMIHDRLYRSESFSGVDMGDHVRELASRIAASFKDVSQAVRMTVEAEPLPMNIDAAVPCGLLVNELVTNAFKHAFADESPGELRVALRREGKMVVLEVEDNGPGLPGGFDPDRAETLGMQLIAALTDQLKGKITLAEGPGTKFRVEFPG